jgi:lipopolysaccharide biosynthesis regulator YciM
MSAFNLLELICLLLPIAAMSGWYMGKRAGYHASENKEHTLSSDYYAGLNFLLNEQPDKAVDAFIRMLDVSPDSVETTLALGNFFRRRGEVDRAIRIHQNLIAKPNLTQAQRSESLLALAQDYLRAGVYDRAESLLLEITNTVGDHLAISLRFLIDIYEREKEWDKAIRVGVRLQKITSESMGKVIAHYYCELAEAVWAKGKIRLAHKYLKRSLRHDPQCARASLLEGNFEKKCAKFKFALRAYQRIETQDASFLPEVLLHIIECYEQLGLKDELTQYLEYLLKQSPSTSIVLANAKHNEFLQHKEHTAHFLVHYMHKQPSLGGLKHLIEFHLSRVMGEVRNELLMLKYLVEQLLEKKPIYRCGECGFSSKRMHWQCPSCRVWAQVKPIQGIEGE